MKSSLSLKSTGRGKRWICRKGFHTYRHTFGTNLCRKGVAIQIASSLLDHADINVTAKYYVDVSQDEKQQAVDLLSSIVNE